MSAICKNVVFFVLVVSAGLCEVSLAFVERLVMMTICSLVLFAYNISYSSKKKKLRTLTISARKKNVILDVISVVPVALSCTRNGC
jgi:hypothetical protein